MPHPLKTEKIYLNALNLIFRENFLQLAKFLDSFTSYQEAFSNLKAEQKFLIDPFQEWEKLEKQHLNFVTLQEPTYPALLKEISFPPQGLYFQGNLSVISSPLCLSIVGTRKMSSYGKLVLEKLLPDLISTGFVIISGLALGVDTLSHRLTLQNHGQTAAILGTGLDRIFPTLNTRLSQEIIQGGGVLISEYPLGTPAYKYHFPWRNRIISGLSPATLVIEAPNKSGALITANFALEQNREVLAIPGSIFSTTSQGTNQLIKAGAKVVTDIEDLLEEYQLPVKEKSNKNNPVLDNETEEIIYRAFNNHEPILVDKLIEMTNLKTDQILTTLTILELKGLIKDLGGGRYIKT